MSNNMEKRQRTIVPFKQKKNRSLQIRENNKENNIEEKKVYVVFQSQGCFQNSHNNGFLQNLYQENCSAPFVEREQYELLLSISKLPILNNNNKKI